MEACSDLEVDVNGEGTFFLNKGIISVYSGKFRKLFGKSTCSEKNLKVIFNDFPGGAESFELVAKFCYNNGQISVTPSNIVLLTCAAEFMEMSCNILDNPNLLEQTEKSMEEIRFWTWPELLVALKQCQDLDALPVSDSLTATFLDSLVGKLSLTVEASPCASTCSPDSSLLRCSCDSKSTESFKNSFTRTTWWFEELLVLGPDLVERLVKLMVSRKFDHFIISRFLFYYQKAKFYSASSDEKRKILETVLDTLYALNRGCIPCKSLFGVLRVAIGLKISKSSKNKLEHMIGHQLDQATLDNLLIPSPFGSNYLYDVNLVLRFAKAFLGGEGPQGLTSQLKKVASLMDLYIAEVAPDPCLKPSKFLALITIIPDSARECHDEIYGAIDMYLEAHGGLSEIEKLNIFRTLDYQKLSGEARVHISCNMKFLAAESLISQKPKLKTFTESSKSIHLPYHPGNEQLILRLEKLEISGDDNEKLKEHLKGIQWRVTELERECRKMQTQMATMKKRSRSTSRGNPRSLPKLCS